ncbi:MAG: hypothetical protein H6702_19360 [Myxococcales bacterium]|nr:hypothetical protein [Myxococcales bacterium]
MRNYDAFEPLADPSEVTGPLTRWFGIPPEAFAEHRFWQRPSAKPVWVAHKDLVPPPGLRPEAFGILVSRMKGRIFKPTSVFIQRFGGAATRNTLRLTHEQLDALLERQTLALEGHPEDGDGLVILRDPDDHPIGMGLLRGGVLESMLPKFWSHPGGG